jgi:hypothetical protein
VAGKGRHERSPRRVHLDQVVDRIAAPQAAGKPEADAHHLGPHTGTLQLLEKEPVGLPPAESGPERDEQDVDPGHQPAISRSARR